MVSRTYVKVKTSVVIFIQKKGNDLKDSTKVKHNLLKVKTSRSLKKFRPLAMVDLLIHRYTQL